MPPSVSISFKGRNVYIVTGRKSQTIRVCTVDNQRGVYEWVIRLFPPNFANKDNIKVRSSIEDLIDYLSLERLGQIEVNPSGTIKHLPKISQLEMSPEDAIWIEMAVRITETCIDEFVREFLELPYLHRVEHSIHTRLYAILSNHPHLNCHLPLAEGSMLAQPIHIEWPEPIKRPEKRIRHGYFDLVILSPGQIRMCNIKDFKNGRLVPPIAIEMGLNYGRRHLEKDAEKLLNSKIQHGYLVHLTRDSRYDPAIDQIVENLQHENTIRVAYARFERGRKFIKLLGDSKIQEVK